VRLVEGKGRKRRGRTGTGVDVVLAFRPQVSHSFVVFVAVLDHVGDVGPRSVGVGELEEVDNDDGVVVAAG
jgi:hypothetical protein